MPCTCEGGVESIETCGADGTWSECDCPEADTSTDTVTDVADEDTAPADTVQPEVECALDADCDDDDVCTDDSCNLDFGLCEWSPVDGDGDGFPAMEVGGTDCGGSDCDDWSNVIYPDAPTLCESMDRNCSGAPDNDEDEDGYLSAELCGSGDDCDETDETVHPGATTSCEDMDRNCDGIRDCAEAACVGVVDCPCTDAEYTCDDDFDEDCDLVDDCADSDCTDPCACADTGPDACVLAETCCHDGCCNTLTDPGCCGDCATECTAGGLCCDGDCQECCVDADCDDLDPCTEDVCSFGSCAHSLEVDGTTCGTDLMCCGGACVECCTGSDCDDSNPCTEDTCSVSGTCSHSNVDSVACAGGDI
jgi:hypothetical protein